MSTKAIKASNKKEKFLAILKELHTGGNTKNSFIEMLKTAGIGLIGAAVGKQVGRPSLVIGAATVMAGHYFDNKRLIVLGVGTIAGGGMALTQSVSGTGGSLGDRLTEGVKNIGSDLKHRLYVDKIIKSKSSTDGVNGVGEVQYFDANNQLNMGSLDAIEDEIARSSARYDQSQFTGSYDDMAGTEDRIL